jgi:preprotein translocase subunit SecD
MKNLIAIVFSLALMLAAGCGKQSESNAKKGHPQTLVYQVDWRAALGERPNKDLRGPIVDSVGKVMGKRLRALGIEDFKLSSASDTITINFSDLSGDNTPTVKRVLAPQGRLALRIVDSDNTWLTEPDQKAAVEALRARYHKENPNNESTVQFIRSRAEESKETPDVARNQPWMGPYLRAQRKSELMQFASDPNLGIPTGRMFGFEKVEIRNRQGQPTGEAFWKTVILMTGLEFSKKKTPRNNSDEIVNADIEKADCVPDDYSGHAVSLKLTAEAAKRFADLTERNVQRYLAIMLEDEVVSVPMIQERIGGGQIRMTLRSDKKPSDIKQACDDLAKTLLGGAYAAPVTFVTP